VELVLGSADGLPDGAVVEGRVAFAKIVGFHLGSVGSNGFLSSSASFNEIIEEQHSPSQPHLDHPTA
jgi:hypothetical protein